MNVQQTWYKWVRWPTCTYSQIVFTIYNIKYEQNAKWTVRNYQRSVGWNSSGVDTWCKFFTADIVEYNTDDVQAHNGIPSTPIPPYTSTTPRFTDMCTTSCYSFDMVEEEALASNSTVTKGFGNGKRPRSRLKAVTSSTRVAYMTNSKTHTPCIRQARRKLVNHLKKKHTRTLSLMACPEAPAMLTQMPVCQRGVPALTVSQQETVHILH